MMGRNLRILLLIASGGIAALAAGYLLTATAVSLSVDGMKTTITTHRATVGEVLADMGIALAEQDAVSPPLSAQIEHGATIQVARTRRVTVRVDGAQLDVNTNAATVGDVLHLAGVAIGARDVIVADGRVTGLAAPLLAPAQAATSGSSLASSVAGVSAVLPLSPARQRVILSERPSPVFLSIRRAVPVQVSDDGVEQTVVTAAASVGEALFGEGTYIFAADQVTPALDSPITAGMRISIRRAKPLTVVADGRTFATRTQAATVRAMLADERTPARNKDYSLPALDSPVTAGMLVKVTRVREETLTEEEPIPFTSVNQLDGKLDLDSRAVMTAGKPGLRKRTVLVVFETDREVQRVVNREWVDQDPVNQVIAYGTHVVIRSMNTANGPIEYWREMRAWTSYYTPSTSGTPVNSPWFGITRTGMKATKGVIAVDPAAIPLHTRMYVPGYGFGAAEDTGSLVVGRTIDLAYDDGDPAAWQFGWMTIYLLTPVPANIPYILPDYPSEGR